MREFEICHPKIFLLWYILLILIWGHLKNSKYSERLSLNSLHLPKDKSSKRNSIVINPLPGSSTNHGRLTHITGEESEVNPTPDKVGHIPLICSFKGPFILLKNQFPSPKIMNIPLPLFLLRWYLILNSEPPWGIIHCSPEISRESKKYIH